MIKNHTQDYLMRSMMDRSMNSREGLILLLIVFALIATVLGSIVTP